jgi:hypothetical protein
MSSLFDSLSEELFQILKGSGKTLTLYGPDGNKTYEPKGARRVFATPDNIMISVIEAGSDSEVKLYLSQSTDVQAISKLINTLRQVTTRYNVLFNVRKYGRELEPKDFAYQASMMEAAMWGSTKTSYQKFGPAKLIVKHLAPVREGIIGARGRNILSMFVETTEGERFKFPETHLSAGRAFANHIAQGGKPHDSLGTQIVELAQESLQLARVNRYIYSARNTLGEGATALRPPIKSRIVEIRKALTSLSKPRGYVKVKEAGLPMASMNLSEDNDFGRKLDELESILQIDSNHALAESLMPVALLTLGENMTDNTEMFHGVITLEDAAADALVEALLDEYGYETANWTRLGSNIAFNETAAFEDAKSALGLMEADFQINEGDAVMDYATQWSNHRLAQSGREGDLETKDQNHHNAGIDQLADGLRAILSGGITTPDFPERAPKFAPGDATVKDRFYLDLYVGQHKLANEATLNYVSTIIDKLAEGQKLDGAEQTVKNILVKALDDDLGGADIDEAFMDDDNDPYYTDGAADSKIEDFLDEFEQDFDGENFLRTQGYEDFVDPTMGPEDKAEPMDAKYFIDGIKHMITQGMEYENLGGAENSQAAMNAADEIFASRVKPILTANGWSLNENIREFAMTPDKPEHHGISTGDAVATDLGHGTVVTVEGDIAVVEFLNGQTKQMHVDDMDKVPELGNVAEEVDLREWFDSFDPSSVLETEFDPTISNGDRVTHKVYGAGVVEATDPRFTTVKFDRPHVRLPASNTVKMSTGVLTKAGRARITQEDEQLDELSQNKVTDYFSRAAGARGKAEKKGDTAKLGRRDRGITMAWKKMRAHEMAEGYTSQPSHSFATYMDHNGEEDTEVEVSYYMDDDIVMIEEIIVKATGETIDYDSLDFSVRSELENKAHEENTELAAAEQDHAYDRHRDDQMDRKMYGESSEQIIRRAMDSLDEATRGPLAEGLMTSQHLDQIMAKFKVFAEKVFADPEAYGVELPVGTDDMDEQEMNFNSSISQVLSGFIAGEIQDVSTNATLESEEVLGGDQGQDLINDTAVDQERQGMDEEAQREFETLMKNANFRR